MIREGRGVGSLFSGLGKVVSFTKLEGKSLVGWC